MMHDPQPSKTIAALAAAKLWKLYGIASAAELVLEDVALARGVLVLEGPLDGAEARLVRSGTKGLIRVKQGIAEVGRKRFAIAHEIGHWELHKLVSQVLACTNQDMVAKYKASVPEIEANYFAAELLMPEALFQPLIRKTRPSWDLVSDLASQFQTSLTATAVRFADITNEYFAVVVSENGKIKWWRASESFESRFWLEAGSPLSPNTVAAAFFRGEAVLRGPQELDIGTWLEAASHASDQTILEEVITMPRYGQALSLLWIHE